MQKTYIPKAHEIKDEWYFVDAKGENLGRLTSKITSILLGKNKPSFTPGIDSGHFVIVINAGQIQVTGAKLDDKVYHHYSGYPSGLKSITLRTQLVKHPDRVIRHAVWGMLPHNKLGRRLIRKLRIYSGSEHPHLAQQPKPIS